MATIQEQLDRYLSDVHSIEEQALPQMQGAPRLAGDPELAAAFRDHLTETERQERRVRERLEARGAAPGRVKDAVAKAGGAGFLLFARLQPDSPGKLTAHAYSYEHLELAAYDLLGRVAERAGDDETAEVARAIADEERAMAERLAGSFDRAVEASLRELDPDDLGDQLVKYLADAHALEAQAIKLLGRGAEIAGDAETARLYGEHREESERHLGLVEQRLEAHGATPSRAKDAALSLGALNWSVFFQAQPDTPAKLAAFAFAFEHLEIAGYEQLMLVARRAGDERTVHAVERILVEERAAASRIASRFGPALDASLAAQGAAA